MSNIQTGAERMPHDLSHLGFLAGQIGRLITISTTPVIAGDSFEMDAVGALRLSPLRRGLAIDSTVDIFTLDRKSGSAGMPRPISYAVFCLKKKNPHQVFLPERLGQEVDRARLDRAHGAGNVPMACDEKEL